MKDIVRKSQEKSISLDGRMMNWYVYISDDDRSLFRRVCASLLR